MPLMRSRQAGGPARAKFAHAIATLRERKRGAFYRGGQGWLHFHEDPAGLFADLKIGGSFARFRVSTKAEQGALLRELRNSLAA